MIYAYPVSVVPSSVVPSLGGAPSQIASLPELVAISLWSWARAEPGDVLPSTIEDKRDRQGWWAESFAPNPSDRMGSRLWLLRRSKATPETLDRAVSYAREALAWLVEDGIAESVEVSLLPGSPAGILVSVASGGASVDLKYPAIWERL